MAIIAPLAIRLALFFSHSSISLRFLSIFALFVLFVLSLVTRQSNYLTSPNRRAPLLLMPSPLLSGQLKGRFRAKSIRKNFAPALSLIFRCSFCFNGRTAGRTACNCHCCFCCCCSLNQEETGKKKRYRKADFTATATATAAAICWHFHFNLKCKVVVIGCAVNRYNENIKRTASVKSNRLQYQKQRESKETDGNIMIATVRK